METAPMNTSLRTLSLAALAVVTTSVGHHPSAQASYPRTLTDAKKHSVTLSARPMRIASTVLGVDENLADLVEPTRIAAMTEIAKLPDVSNIADRIPAGKTFVKDQWQVVIDAKPDLVLTAIYTPTLADPLIARKLPVYQFTEFRSIEALLKNFELLGQLVGEEQKAQQILKADRAALGDAAKKTWPKAIRAIYFSEGSLFATGTVPSEVLTRAGLIDAATEFGLSGHLKATPTLMANLHPDAILFGEDNKEAEQETAELFRKPDRRRQGRTRLCRPRQAHHDDVAPHRESRCRRAAPGEPVALNTRRYRRRVGVPS
jgi:iron complex transport system substrate-binding protein